MVSRVDCTCGNVQKGARPAGTDWVPGRDLEGESGPARQPGHDVQGIRQGDGHVGPVLQDVADAGHRAGVPGDGQVVVRAGRVSVKVWGRTDTWDRDKKVNVIECRGEYLTKQSRQNGDTFKRKRHCRDRWVQVRWRGRREGQAFSETELMKIIVVNRKCTHTHTHTQTH